MFCKSCGAKIDDNSVFCQSCGVSQKTAPTRNTEEKVLLKDIAQIAAGKLAAKKGRAVLTNKRFQFYIYSFVDISIYGKKVFERPGELHYEVFKSDIKRIFVEKMPVARAISIEEKMGQ